MTDGWDERRKAQEEGYFDKLNKEALARLSKKSPSTPRPSPVTGKPMEQVTMLGVVIDRCADSGGIWLDAGELEQIIEAIKQSPTQGSAVTFFERLLGKK